MSKMYGVYDMTDYEQCVYLGNLKEVSEFLGHSANSLRSFMSKNNTGRRNALLQKKYNVVAIEDETEEEAGTIKSNEEIFKELINAFMPEKVKFKEFDYFKWQLKGIKDKIIIDEEWKQIEDFHYSLSNYGRVRNDLNNKIKNPRFHRWILQVDIYENGKRYTVNIKRLVAEYFIRKLNEGERVKNIDGDSRNNYFKNLEIVSK